MASEPVDKLSDVLMNLQDFHGPVPSTPDSRRVMAIQIDVLLEVQEQMKEQLRLHDSQIALLQDLIKTLTDSNK